MARITSNRTGTVTVDIYGDTNLAHLRRLEQRLPAMFDATAKAGAYLYMQLAEGLAPVQHENSLGFMQNDHYQQDGRSLRESFQVKKFGDYYFVQNTAPHAAAQEFGAEAHGIPQFPGMINFWWENEHKFFSTKHSGPVVVDHPGNAPQPFMGPAARSFAPRFGAMVRRALEEAG